MRLRWLTILTAFGALFAGYFVPAAPASAQQTLCNLIYQPVCARTKVGTVQTFTNACFARVAGATVVQQGPCPFLCPLNYAPVCGRKGGVNKTYGNSCFAMADGAVVLADGTCPGRICTFIYLPVCAVPPGGGLKTFPNRCVAINNGARILHNGKC